MGTSSDADIMAAVAELRCALAADGQDRVVAMVVELRSGGRVRSEALRRLLPLLLAERSRVVIVGYEESLMEHRRRPFDTTGGALPTARTVEATGVKRTALRALVNPRLTPRWDTVLAVEIGLGVRVVGPVWEDAYRLGELFPER